MGQKIIIDTDIGDDIDDALAIVLALRSPELELTGITTVYGNVELRTKLTLKLLQVFNRADIPVATGIGHPLCEKNRLKPPVPCQCMILKPDEKLPSPAKEEAIDFIILKVLSNPKEITLVPIGALTNVASAISKEPRLKETLKEIVMMGGVVGEEKPEWNILCDPEAAEIVFKSGIPIKMIGLDVTMKCEMTEGELSKIEQDKKPQIKFLTQLIRLWQTSNNRRCPILHDPLALAAVIDPGFVKTEKKTIEVDTSPGPSRAVTFSVGGQPNADVAIQVDRDRFVSMFLDRITG